MLWVSFYFPFPISLSIGTCTSFLTSPTETPVNRYIATDQKTVASITPAVHTASLALNMGQERAACIGRGLGAPRQYM